MQKKLFLSLFLVCAAAGNARAEILWQDDPQDIYASGFFWPAYDEYFQALPYEPSAADRLGRLWGIFAREAGSADTWAEWQGWQQAEQLYRNGQYREAFEAFLPLADNGNVLAQLRISEQYAEGKGVPEDGEHASMWYERASVALPYGAYPLYDAQMHVADAETRYQLGQMYSMGAGVRGNRKAAEIMQALAGEGFAKAMLDLSEMYDAGGALPTDPAQMFYWREQAATHGDASLQFLVAEYYEREKNAGRARYWYERVATSGGDSWFAAFALDHLYNFAVRRGDMEQAETWRNRAVRAWRTKADADDAYAQYRLGDLLSRGDAAEAAQAKGWLEKAAAQGEEAAAKRLQEIRRD